METITLPHLPPTTHSIHAILFEKVQNAAFLRQQLLAGNTEFEYAFLDASVLLSRKHVLAACWKAINESLQERLKTRNVHSEIVFALSTNNNIAESFRRFGISEDSTNLLAIKVSSSDTASTIEQHLLEHVKGTPVPFTDENLAKLHDPARIRKIYRVEAPKKGEALVLGKEAEAFIVGSMALKGS